MSQLPKHASFSSRQTATGVSGLYLTSGISGIMTGDAARDRIVTGPRPSLMDEMWEIYDGVVSLNCDGSAKSNRPKTGS